MYGTTIGYAAEQMGGAVGILADHGTLRDRMESALHHKLLWAPTDHLSEDLKKEIDELKANLTAKPVGELTDEELSRFSDRIVAAYRSLLFEYGEKRARGEA